jgi:hypothetical protein
VICPVAGAALRVPVDEGDDRERGPLKDVGFLDGMRSVRAEKFAAAVSAGSRASPESGGARRYCEPPFPVYSPFSTGPSYTENLSIWGRYEHAVLLTFRLTDIIYGNHLISV